MKKNLLLLFVLLLTFSSLSAQIRSERNAEYRNGDTYYLYRQNGGAVQRQITIQTPHFTASKKMILLR